MSIINKSFDTTLSVSFVDEAKTLEEWIDQELEANCAKKTKVPTLDQEYQRYAQEKKDVHYTHKSFVCALKKRLRDTQNVYFRYENKRRSVAKGLAFKTPKSALSLPLNDPKN